MPANTFFHARPAPTVRFTMMVLPLALLLLAGCGTSVKNKESVKNREKDAERLTLDVNTLKMTMLADISSIIFSDSEIPADVKADIIHLAISPLRKLPEIQIAGTDQTTRPVAVSFQGAFEQSVVNMVDKANITRAITIIHTRKPATPLCNPPGKSLAASLHPSMRGDPVRRKTIADRTITLRSMAKTAPIDLYIAYVHGGFSKRMPEEQAVYQAEVSNPENISLHDSEMACTEMPDEIVGASYILTTRHGNLLYFGNNGRQAFAGSGNTLWRYWFGSLQEAPIDRRYQEVLEYLNKCGLDIQP